MTHRINNAVTRRNVVIGLGAAAALGIGAGSARAQNIKKRVIRFGYGLAESSPSGEATRFFAEQVGELSGGKMNVKTYGNGSLGSDEQMMQALIGGSQEITWVSTAPLATYIKNFGVFDLPFLFDSYATADAVLDGPEGQKLLDMVPSTGMVALNYWENGFRNITNSRHAIAKASDIKGIKLRVMQNEVALAVFKALGANAIPMEFTELFTALETKTVDGQENPLSTIRTSKFYEVQKYLTTSRHVYTPFVLLVSQKWWDKLSDDERGVIEQAAKTSQQFQRKISREADADSLQYLQEQGMEVSEFPAEELEVLRETVQPVVQTMRDKIGADTVDAVFQAARDASA